MASELAICWGELERTDADALLKAASAFASKNSLTVQLFDAESIAGEDHLRSAAFHALRARERGTMRTSNLGMEMLLYASGKRQIRDAIAAAGVGPATRRLAAMLVGKGADGHGDGLLRALGARKASAAIAGGAGALARLGIDGRLGADADLALEAVALLDTER
jgi:KEOPS complex subunit Cgi121